MTRFSDRMPEVAALLNPAFTARLLFESTDGFSASNGDPMPFPLAFLTLPLVLHEETRQALPKDRRKRFAAWIAEHPWIVTNFPSRAAEMMELTREGLRFALRAEVLRITDEGGLQIGRAARPALSSQSTDVASCAKAARLVGMWFQTTDVATTFALLGVRP